MILDALVNIAYLLGTVAFVWGLRLLSSPDTARKGNLIAGAGMGLAILATIVVRIDHGDNNMMWIMISMIIGGLIGWQAAVKVQMTSMPQMVSIFNGLGGACAMVLAFAEYLLMAKNSGVMETGKLSIICATLAIGAVSFTGSLLAYGKLEGKIDDSKVTLPKHSWINTLLLLITIGLAVYISYHGNDIGIGAMIALLIISLIYGFSFVAPIGGADMPVVISLLNSFTGLSAAAAGLIYNNMLMMVGGILVGASGTILTVIMCKAMNRSLLNVLLGGFGGPSGKGKSQDGLVAKEVSISDAAIQLFYSQTVTFVPGYGLAVAQAQKAVKELDDLLEKNGVDVRYAIHPVAGRMPGHMNVLLAEADVPYPKLMDLEDANTFLKGCNIVVVVGANDVVNPAALDDPSSPIYGMPVLEVWEADHVIVMKRGMSPGYAGIENPLFFHNKTRMLFGDAKDSIQKLVTEVKGLG